MSGRYCEKHEEWAPSGECRWCDVPTINLTIWSGELKKIHAGSPPPLREPPPSPGFGDPMTMTILMGPMLGQDKKP